MKQGMNKAGVKIGRINYQENGNWKPHLHVHLYCRAIDAVKQKYGDPIIPGHQKDFKPLTEEDIINIQIEINGLIVQEKYSDKEWGLE